MASSVIGLPINSGLPGRSADDFVTEICDGQLQEFLSGDHHSDVVYILSSTDPQPADMSCRPISGTLEACRTIAS